MNEILDHTDRHTAPQPVGAMLREWRQRRHLSQLELALEAGISQRHLSFVENGRSMPSREMLAQLTETLDVPLRHRNRVMLAAGYAPNFPERSLDDPALKGAMAAVQQILDGHAPNPALAINRHWEMVAANTAIAPFLEGVANASLLAPPVNVLRLSLHPEGIAPRIVNLAIWRTHVLERLRILNDRVADPALTALEEELRSYPGAYSRTKVLAPADTVAVPLQLRVGDEVLSFITTTTVFGSPLDVTLSELAIESFFPTDRETADHLRRSATS